MNTQPPPALIDELAFRVSLLRLLTEPHPDTRTNAPAAEARQIEEMVTQVPVPSRQASH